MESVTKITKIHGAKGKNEAEKQGQSLNQWCYIIITTLLIGI